MKKELLKKFVNTKAGELFLKTVVAPTILIGCLAGVVMIWLEDKL